MTFLFISNSFEGTNCPSRVEYIAYDAIQKYLKIFLRILWIVGLFLLKISGLCQFSLSCSRLTFQFVEREILSHV